MAERGYDTSVGIGKASVWGTFTTPTVWAPCRSYAVDGENVLIERTGVRQKSGRPLPSKPGLYNLTGDFQFEVDADDFTGLLLKGLMGTETVAQQGTTLAYKHTFTIGDTPFFSIQVDKDTEAYDVVSAKISSITAACSLGELLLITPSWICNYDRYQPSPVTPSYSVIDPFTFVQATVSIAGSADSDVDDFSFTVSRGLQVKNVLGDRFTKEPILGGLEVTGTFTKFFATSTEYRRFWGSTTATQPQASLTAATVSLKFEGDIAAGTYKYSLEFIFPNVLYTAASVPIAGKDALKQSISFSSYESAGNDDIKIELVNVTSSAY